MASLQLWTTDYFMLQYAGSDKAVVSAWWLATFGLAPLFGSISGGLFFDEYLGGFKGPNIKKVLRFLFITISIGAFISAFFLMISNFVAAEVSFFLLIFLGAGLYPVLQGISIQCVHSKNRLLSNSICILFNNIGTFLSPIISEAAMEDRNTVRGL